MKRKISKILILFFVFLIVVLFLRFRNVPHKYTILEVLEADEFVIDFNKNNLIDPDEYVKLKSVSAYKPIKDYISIKNARDLGLTIDEYLKAGYIARTWAKKELLDKEVYVLKSNTCYKGEMLLVDIFYNNLNYSLELLKNGLAYPNKHISSKKYFQFLNIKETKLIAKEIKNIAFVMMNLKNNIIHNLYCEHAKKISNGELFLKNGLNLKTNVFCKKCFEINIDNIVRTYNIPKSKNIYKKSISKKFDNVELFLINPLEYQKPNISCSGAFCKKLIYEINNAKNEIDIALYGIGDQKEIYSALLNAKKRGVKIRAVSDFSRNLIETYSFSDEFNKDFNAVLDKTSSLMHNKFFIFDNKVVMSGSLNISATGSGGYNSNNAVFIYDENIAKVYSEEFNQMYNSKFSKEKNSSNLKQDNSIIKAYFSPKDNVYNNVLKQKILNAKKSIYISAFYLTDKDMINDLISVSNKGIEVLIILDATSANNFKELVHKMRSNNIKLIVENWGGKNHEKTIAIDDDTLIIGSCNFSKSGFYKNDENILVFKNSSMTKFYKDYYLYLFNSIDKKYLISIPRAEGAESINSCNDGIDNNFDGKIDNKDEACKIN